MAGMIKLAIVDDDPSTGIRLKSIADPGTKPGTPALPIPPIDVALAGKCVDSFLKNDGSPGYGSDILNDAYRPALARPKPSLCDLTKDTQLRVKLNIDGQAATFAGVAQPFCLEHAKGSGCLDSSYVDVTFPPRRTDVMFVTLKKLDAGAGFINDKFYSIRFKIPSTTSGQLATVSFDPKVINKPRDGDSIALALTGLLVAGGATLLARRFLAGHDLRPDRANLLSVVIGLAVGVAAVFALRPLFSQ